jgi:hypothetical protein
VKRRVAAVAAIAVALLVVLNVTGVMRYPGGPLRQAGVDAPLWLDVWPSGWGNSPVGNTADADWATPDTDLIWSNASLANDSPWPATVESIEPLDIPNNLEWGIAVRKQDAPSDDVVSAYGPLDDAGRAVLARSFARLPVEIGPGDANRTIAIPFRSSDTGPVGFEALAINYRIGPFKFRVVYRTGLHACLGTTPVERNCPEALPE